ncbi:hypothetical protein EPI10_016262 [Gossypium australe]|uniref:Transmembrane protein n=1 Tax=Gossypium australe TaxID=47621 RepID=A0A5B6VNG5_9ROSI|nr:hypothetical protein EPI10_016262 [Gossypium australe]
MNWDKMKSGERMKDIIFSNIPTVTHPLPNPSNFSFISFHVLPPLLNHPSSKLSFFLEIYLVKAKKKIKKRRNLRTKVKGKEKKWPRSRREEKLIIQILVLVYIGLQCCNSAIIN